MEIKKKENQLIGMSGWDIKNTSISLALDSFTDSYSVKILGIHEKGEFEYISREEMELLVRLFKLK